MRLMARVFAVVCLLGAGPGSQTAVPFVGELKQNYGLVKNNLLRLADKMPEEHYASAVKA